MPATPEDVRRHLESASPPIHKRVLRLYSKRVFSRFLQLTQRVNFVGVSAYCAFLGYPRSGHTFVGAALNAHRNCVISNELDATWYLYHGLGRDQIFHSIVYHDRRFGKRDREVNGYSYLMPETGQGDYGDLLVIGDKKAFGTTRLLFQHPDFLHAMRTRLGVPLKFVHVIRNPFDIVATITKRHGWTPEIAALQIGEMVRWVTTVMSQLDSSELIHVHHEQIISEPGAEFERLFRFMGLSSDAALLERISSHVFASAHRSRDDVEWTDQAIESTQAVIESTTFLRHYSFAAT